MKTGTRLLLSFMTAAMLSFILLSPYPSFSQKKPPPKLTRIEFLFDASQSMLGRWESNSKFEIAKRLLTEIVDSLQYLPNIELALHVYGHTKRFPPQDCDDNRLEVPFGPESARLIRKKLKELTPMGTTPIARSLEECGKDFPDLNARNIIILITDGIEECDGDPCAVSQALQKKGIVLKPFVIGLGMTRDYLKSFEIIYSFTSVFFGFLLTPVHKFRLFRL